MKVLYYLDSKLGFDYQPLGSDELLQNVTCTFTNEEKWQNIVQIHFQSAITNINFINDFTT
jgi:hypothetical protein